MAASLPGERRPMRLRLAALACLVAISSSCGRAGPDEGAQPAPAVTTFEQGRFDDIPLFPRSEPVGPRSEKDGVVARSYKALGASPEQVLDFYRDGLPSQWRMVTPLERLGVDTYRADWEDGQYRLRVSATLEPLLRGPNEASNAAVSQYSLSLHPL
ncbi:MAG: hypothetical protein ACLGHT_06630 [Acidimicrobiia bacterium]